MTHVMVSYFKYRYNITDLSNTPQDDSGSYFGPCSTSPGSPAGQASRILIAELRCAGEKDLRFSGSAGAARVFGVLTLGALLR